MLTKAQTELMLPLHRKRQEDGSGNLLSSLSSLPLMILYWILFFFCERFSPSIVNKTTTLVLIPVVYSYCKRVVQLKSEALLLLAGRRGTYGILQSVTILEV